MIITRANQTQEASFSPVQASTAPAELMSAVSDTFARQAAEIHQRSKEKYAADLDVQIKRDVARIERENSGNPVAMQKAFDGFRSGFLGGISDKEMRAKAASTFDVSTLPPINRAYSVQRAVLDNETLKSATLRIEENKKVVADSAPMLFSDDRAARAAAVQSMSDAMLAINESASLRSRDGGPLLSGSAVAGAVIDAKDLMLGSIALAWLGNQEDRATAVRQFINGDVVVSLPDGENEYQVNLAEGMSLAARKQYASQMARVVSAEDAARAQGAADLYSGLDLAESRGELTYQQLDAARETIGEAKYTTLAKRIDDGISRQLESDMGVRAIAGVLAGDSTILDLSDKKVIAAANDYYDQKIVPAISGMDEPVALSTVARFVERTGVLPDKLKGEMRSAFRTGTADQIARMSDLVSRIEEKSPQTFRDFSDKDLAYFDLVSDQVNTGIDPKEAVQNARQITSSENHAVMTLRRNELKQKDLDSYSKAANRVFSSILPDWVFGGGQSIKATTPMGARIVTDYKDAYDTFYMLTGDEDIARKRAEKQMRGMYGETRFNEGAVVAYPPEWFYGIPGTDDPDGEWMRKQLDRDVSALGYEKGKAVILSDATTKRQASMNRPTYAVVVEDDDGVFSAVLDSNGNPLRWAPRPEKRKGQLRAKLEKERQKRAERKAEEARKREIWRKSRGSSDAGEGFTLKGGAAPDEHWIVPGRRLEGGGS